MKYINIPIKYTKEKNTKIGCAVLKHHGGHGHGGQGGQNSVTRDFYLLYIRKKPIIIDF